MRGIITLCGSVRFEEHFRIANSELTLAGWIGLAPGCFNHSFLHQPENDAERTKNGLDELHLEKIKMSDSIFVLDPRGYVGKSTSGEMAYALRNGKKIYRWSTGDLRF